MKRLARLFLSLIFVLTFGIPIWPAFMNTASALAQEILLAHNKEMRFFAYLGQEESSGNYNKVNKFGYLGKYQFGEQALISLGYYSPDGSKRNDWKGIWSGKSGVFSKQDFLQNKFIQEVAVRELADFHWSIAVSRGMNKFVGKKIYGVHITKEGILAAMHLVGPKSVENFLVYGVDSSDGLGTSIRHYMSKFSKVL